MLHTTLLTYLCQALTASVNLCAVGLILAELNHSLSSKGLEASFKQSISFSTHRQKVRSTLFVDYQPIEKSRIDFLIVREAFFYKWNNLGCDSFVCGVTTLYLHFFVDTNSPACLTSPHTHHELPYMPNMRKVIFVLHQVFKYRRIGKLFILGIR